MKKSLQRFTMLLAVFLLLAAPSMNFDVMLPARISFPPHIKSVAMIDRSVPEDNVRNAIEGGLTGELIGQDKHATQIVMDGIHSIMANSPTLAFKRTTESLHGGTLIGSAFPDPISWERIDELCKKHQSDALLAIEIFDSDFIMVPGKGQMVNVKVGIRMYDPRSKTIIDQYNYTHQSPIMAAGKSWVDVVGSFIDKSAEIRDASYDAGVVYGQRITPSWYRVSRKYYRRSKRDQNLALGARMMEVNDWPAAKEALHTAVETGKRKTRGRAAHNMAVVFEIEGDLPEAKSWAQTAWGNYRNKKSRDYLFDLNHRINQNNLLQQQLEQ
jgi:hypothetical protein